MKKIFEILKAHKYAIIWTVCYTATMWAILRFLFNFNMFSGAYWCYLFHAKLNGFPGFVFGILLLAALPLYIATTTLIIRTKKPLVTIPVPKPVKKIWANMQPTLINPPAPDTPEEKKSNTTSAPQQDALPDELPSELRTAYIRARMNITPEQRSAFNQPISQIPQPISNMATPIIESELDDIPLPSDFDIEPTTPDSDFLTPDFTQMPAPTFTDITFDDTPDNTPSNPISEYLDSTGKQYEIIDDIIITDKHAIASHTDEDFWVCDDEFWFATGKQIESPIARVTKIATERKLIPTLYMGAENIMDIDTLCKTWESMGIQIIKSPDEISD